MEILMSEQHGIEWSGCWYRRAWSVSFFSLLHLLTTQHCIHCTENRCNRHNNTTRWCLLILAMQCIANRAVWLITQMFSHSHVNSVIYDYVWCIGVLVLMAASARGAGGGPALRPLLRMLIEIQGDWIGRDYFVSGVNKRGHCWGFFCLLPFLFLLEISGRL